MAIEKRGFASMNPRQRRQIAQKDGEAAHEKGTMNSLPKKREKRAEKVAKAAVPVDENHNGGIDSLS